MIDVSKHFENGCAKYGERNWEKGIPVHCYIDSGIRHLVKYLKGQTEEAHDRAFVWNMMCCSWTMRNCPELDDFTDNGRWRMQIQIDSREKARAITKIVAEFEKREIKHFTSKMYVGDYCNLLNPLLIIDRKQNIAEIAQNATSGHSRLKRELERLDEMGGRMIFLIEQNTINQKPITCLEDIQFWKPKFGTINGLQIYRVLSAWKHKHNIDFVFCAKKDTGKEIIRLLTRE